MNRFKYTLGIIAGTVAAMLIIFLLEMVNSKLYPLPAGYTISDMKDINKARQIVSLMPVSAFVSILIIYAIGSYLGGIIASAISGREKNWPAIVTGIILFSSALWDAISLEQPMWFMAGCMACIPFAWYGYFSTRKK